MIILTVAPQLEPIKIQKCTHHIAEMKQKMCFLVWRMVESGNLPFYAKREICFIRLNVL